LVRLLQELAVSPDSCPPFSLTSGVLWHSGRIWVGANS
jgi:hypothetical protein